MALLKDGEILTGNVIAPHVERGRLKGAVLSFPDTSETALLRCDWIGGEWFLSNLFLDEEVIVQISITQGPSGRKVLAQYSDQGQEHSWQYQLYCNGARPVSAEVIDVSPYGLEVKLLEGLGANRIAHINAKNLVPTFRVNLGTIVDYKKGERVSVQIIEVRHQAHGAYIGAARVP